MAINLSDSIRVGQQKPIDDKYYNQLVPYISVTEANSLLPSAIRYKGLTVNVNGVEYWYKDGITNADLVEKIVPLNGTGFVKVSGTTISYDNSTYITTISGIAAGGELEGTYPNPILSNSAVTGKLLTGLNITGGGIVATDSILVAFGKIQNEINGLIGGSTYEGTWNANTNTPTLTSSVGTLGNYYIVNVAGTTNLNGITDWQIGDWAIYDGSAWQKVDNTDAVITVNGYIGNVNLVTGDIPEGAGTIPGRPSQLYFTDARARASLSFLAGSGAYNSSTGVITIPTNNNQITNGANYITLGSLSASSPLLYDSLVGSFIIQQANTSQNGYLSSTDWNTFNNKQSALINPITGSGTTNKIPIFTGTTTLGDSFITQTSTGISLNSGGLSTILEILGTNSLVYGQNNLILGVGASEAIYINSLRNVGIGTSSPVSKLDVVGTIATTEFKDPRILFNSTNTTANNRNWDIVPNLTSYGNLDIRYSTAANINPTVSILRLRSDGNVGIGLTGTSNPTQRLEVSGNIKTISTYTPSGTVVTFTKPDNSLIYEEFEPGLAITRNENGGIYNPLFQSGWSEYLSNMEWNGDGWGSLNNLNSRTYTPFLQTAVGGGLGNLIVNKELILRSQITGNYYKIKFTSWTQGGGGGGFVYDRENVNYTGKVIVDTTTKNQFLKGDGSLDSRNYLEVNSLGIATLNPTYLPQAGSRNPVLYFNGIEGGGTIGFGSSGVYNTNFGTIDNFGGNFFYNSYNNGSHHFRTSFQNRLIISNGGNILIGTGSSLNAGIVNVNSLISFPNATDNSANAYNAINKSHTKLVSNNNTMVMGVDNVLNSRLGWIQVGHESPVFASATGNLTLNPLGGNVGVGTTSPIAKLHVAGTSTYNSDTVKAFRVSDSTTLTKGVDIGYDTVLDKGFIQAANFTVNWSDLLLQPNAGNVGIGTTTPFSKIHVVGGATTTSIVNAATTVTSRFDTANPPISLGIGYVFSDIPMLQSFNNVNNTSTNLTINPFGGNVGIGTATPLSKFQVSSDFGKTDTTNRTIGAFASNDVSDPTRIVFGITGAATQANRVSTIQTDEFGVASSGTLALQPFGGSCVVGGITTAERFEVSGTARATRLGLGLASNAAAHLALAANTTTIGQTLMTPSATDYTGTVSGMFWNNASEIKFYDGVLAGVNRLVKTSGNQVFAGVGNVGIVGNNLGDLGTVPIVERLQSGIITRTANYTVALTDVGANGTVLVRADATAGNVTITLPTAASSTGITFIVKKVDSSVNTVTVSVASNIDGSTTKVYNTQYTGASIMSNGTDFNIVSAF